MLSTILGVAAFFLFRPDTTAATEDALSDAPTTGNVFYQVNNTQFTPGELLIRPKHVYYDGDEIVAVCFVLNGTGTTVSNIHVEKLILYDREYNVVSAASFGEIEDMVLAPNGYAEWTFRFPASSIRIPDADLRLLHTYSDCVDYGK